MNKHKYSVLAGKKNFEEGCNPKTLPLHTPLAAWHTPEDDQSIRACYVEPKHGAFKIVFLHELIFVKCFLPLVALLLSDIRI